MNATLQSKAMAVTSSTKRAAPHLNRETFRTSRLLDFASEKELQAATEDLPRSR